MSVSWRSQIDSGCLFVSLVAALFLSSPAIAGCMSQTVGNTTVRNCNGKIIASQTVGATTVHLVDGRTATSHTTDPTTVYSFNGKFGWSDRRNHCLRRYAV